MPLCDVRYIPQLRAIRLPPTLQRKVKGFAAEVIKGNPKGFM